MATNIWALLFRAEKDGASVYGVSFPDFPGVASGGKTADEALVRGCNALEFHISGMVEDKEPLPELRTLDGLQADPDVQEALRDDGAIIVRVPVEIPGKQVRINISIDDGLLASIDRAAKSSGKSRSGFIASAAKNSLREMA